MKRRFWLSSGTIFLDETLFAAIVPLLPLFAAQFDLTSTAVGITVAAYPLLLLVSALPTGFLADRFGVRKLLLAGTGLIVLATLGFAFAETTWQLWASRGVQGFASGITSVAGMAAIAASAGAGRRGTVIGLAGALTGLSTFAGPALGGFAVPALGLEVAFLLPAAFGVVLVVGLLLPGWVEPTIRQRRPLSGRQAAGLLRNRLVRASMACILADALVGGAVSTIVPLELAADGYSTSQIGALLLVGACFGLVATALAGRFSDTRGVGTVATWWAIAMVGLTVGLALSSITVMVAALFVCLLPLLRAGGSIGFALSGAAAPLGAGLGASYGLMLSAWAAGAVVGPIVAGALADTVSSRAGIFFAAFAALALLPAVAASRREAPRECTVG